MKVGAVSLEDAPQCAHGGERLTIDIGCQESNEPGQRGPGGEGERPHRRPRRRLQIRRAGPKYEGLIDMTWIFRLESRRRLLTREGAGARGYACAALLRGQRDRPKRYRIRRWSSRA